MSETSKYLHKTKTLLGRIQRQLKELSHSKYTHDRKVWAAAIVVIIGVIFWVLPAYAGKAPGQLGYGIKRGEESLAANLAPLSSWRDQLRLDFADNRVIEAGYVADRANQSRTNNPTKTAATINDLLGSFENVYEVRTSTLNQQLADGKKISKADASEFRADAVGTYDELQLLRLQAPGAAQLSVLTSIDDVQQNIAALNDHLGVKPLSTSDLSRLSNLVTIGVISQAQANQLSAITSNRQLHTQLVNMIDNGQLPSDITYQLDEDLIKQVEPENATRFDAVSEFEQMQRISAVIVASRPSTAQKQVIQTYLRSYQPGQTVPTDGSQQYVAPVVYGIALSGKLLNNLRSLNGVHMSSDNQQLFNKWKKIVDPPNLSEVYQRLTTAAQDQPQLSLRNLTRMQQELVAAQQAQVSYLVMPPGWGTAQLGKLNTQMGVQIATEQFQASKPDTNQALASITATQQQLQAKLDALETSHRNTITQLQTQINNFQGTSDQLAQLKNDLAALEQAQATTINNLQTQLTNIIDAHTKLGDSIENLRQEQLTNLTELELRATTNAQQLTDSSKAQLTASLNQIDSHSQTLINNLQTKVDSLDSSQSQLRSQLTTQINTIKADYQVLKTDVQAQLDAGVVTSSQLQSSLTQIQNNLVTQVTKLNDLSDGTTALRQFVDQIKSDTGSQIQSLQDELSLVKLDQQTTKTAVADLRTIQQSSQTLISGLQSQVNDLGVGQTQLRNQLTGEINTIKGNYQTLATSVQAQLDAGVATTDQLRTVLDQARTDIASQQSQLSQVNANTTALTQLVNQVKTDSTSQIADLQGQINTVKLDQQTTNAAVSELQALTQSSQNLINGLQGRVDALGSGQTQLRTELTGQIQTVQDNYTQLAAYTQAQIDAGVATTTQLQTNLQSVQASLSQHAAQLASLSTGNDALTQLVNQVKTDSQSQVNNLQDQINGLAISQQATQATLSNLQDQQAADTAQLTSQLASLSVLQTQAQAAITALDQQQTQAQGDINNLSSNFDVLQTAFNTSEQIQTTMQANIADQQSALDSLQTQTQSSIDTLTQQQSQLSGQITSLANNVTTLSQTLATVQAAGSATQTQLNTLLANPPWAIPAGTYVTQSQFDTLSAQINAQFAAKSAALDAQFQTYQQTLNASVNQLNSQVQSLNSTVSSTSAAQTQQQTQINSLSSQIQTLQTQVQQLLHASTPGGGL